jgi:hypothetical protein
MFGPLAITEVDTHERKDMGRMARPLIGMSARIAALCR